jgi:hypothetical protein
MYEQKYHQDLVKSGWNRTKTEVIHRPTWPSVFIRLT